MKVIPVEIQLRGGRSKTMWYATQRTPGVVVCVLGHTPMYAIYKALKELYRPF